MLKKEHSYGIIPLRRQNGEWQTLLVKHRKGHWAFPKGHPDANTDKSPQQTATRELKEETALRIARFLEVPPLEEHYTFSIGSDQVDKAVTYFIAEVSGTVSIQVEEIEAYQWLTCEEAEKQATFSESKRLCRSLLTILK